MPRWLSLVERETCNLVVAGSIPVRGLYFYIYQNIYILLDYNIVMYSICGTIGQLGRSFGLWEPETPVRIRVVPFFIYTRLSSIWQSVGLQIQMLLVQVRQAGFYICFKFYFLNEIPKHLYTIYYILLYVVMMYHYIMFIVFALVVQGLSCGPVEPATRVQIPARALNNLS